MVQVVDVESSPARHYGELEREPGEARMPWSWERAEGISDAFVEELCTVNMAVDLDNRELDILP
jgi:hypothetical protein